MKVVGADGMTVGEIKIALQLGAKFVIFEYCVSVVVMTFKRPSDIYFIRPGESAALKGLPYTLLSLILGWWGLPWGPIYTIQALATDLGGGKDVTSEVLASFQSGQPG